jgi:hypothetical protein
MSQPPKPLNKVVRAAGLEPAPLTSDSNLFKRSFASPPPESVARECQSQFPCPQLPPTVAVLCVSRKSVYHRLSDVECYDASRDAYSFLGGCPVVTHAPCRAWSAFTSHQAKPLPGEKELAIFCAQRLRECGGVFEHPAHSRAFAACCLPVAGQSKGDLWTIEVWGAEFGFRLLKRTWLCFSGVSPRDVKLPARLVPHGGDRRREQLMSRNQRAATTLEMAEWLVNIARSSHFPSSASP